jgi:gluconate 2-dehydrogenase subunit 3-like protein
MNDRDTGPRRIDRRATIKWILTAAAGVTSLGGNSLETFAASPATVHAKGYGTDPDLIKTYQPGELWPLTFTPGQRRTARTVCDIIIPADEHSPSASAVGVVDFIDEWVSAPYPRQRRDRQTILEGFDWLDAESTRRFAQPFAALAMEQQDAICADICHAAKAAPDFATAAKFFALYRNLTAGGFYTTPAGMKDLGYVGNVPLARFDGPPLEVLKAAGLA